MQLISAPLRPSWCQEEEEKKRPLSRSGSTNRILSPLGQRLSPVRESKTLEREREGQLRTLASKVAALEASNRLVVEALEVLSFRLLWGCSLKLALVCMMRQRHKGELDSLRQFKEAQLASEDVNGSLIELNQVCSSWRAPVVMGLTLRWISRSKQRRLLKWRDCLPKKTTASFVSRPKLPRVRVFSANS